MQPMKLTASELKCLHLIASHGGKRASELREELHALPPHVSRVLAVLIEKGFVRTEKVGLSKTVSLSETKHATLWRKMAFEFGHMPLDAVLAGPSLEVLSAICCLKLRSRKEISENSLVSEASVAKALETLRQVGIAQKIGSTYSVSPRFHTLKEFVTEFRHYLNQRIAREFAGDAVILWECNSEFIIESTKSEEENGFQLTGVSAFARFSIPLLAPKSHLFFSPFAKELTLEDVILHSLLVGDRNMLSVLLVWKKNERTIDMNHLKKQSERYGAKDSMSEVVAYFASEGRERAVGFPPWNEFARRAKEYGVL